MIDFIKMNVSHVPQDDWRNNPILKDKWKITVDNATGEEIRAITKIDGLTITLFRNGYSEIYGSLHKYYNNRNDQGDQNHDDFTYTKLIWVVKDLNKRFGIIAERAIIRNMEYGVNIPVHMYPSLIIQENFILFWVSQITKIAHFRGTGYYTEVEMSDYFLKIYDKSRQYKLGQQHLLRFEVKTRKSRMFSKFGIKNLSDILDVKKLHLLGNDLLSKLRCSLIVDKVSPKECFMSEDEALLYTQGTNPKYWVNLHNDDSDSYKNKRSRFKRLCTRYDLLCTKAQLMATMETCTNRLLTQGDPVSPYT